ncbi:MAG: hypothetical protein K9N09_09420 [Candidatus Cloacimonetes bacterium]|nr:hypothetical protein [Candidatus Cloacimonadota bacterium]MCF7813881.1 hypothetical protein [Candidatus Cloacimonadota bacterium]MCF7868908.1 hypothetical protein [Candidatus Cloacimonadota bacterium]MCF7883993.1 hypothetical protein [Candidatus Cloacimonadota bacterium]
MPSDKSQTQDPYLLRLSKDEKLYKIFIFRPKAGADMNFEYRILTKEAQDGTLEMVSYNFKIIDNVPQKTSIMRSKNIQKEQIDDIVFSVKLQTNTSEEEFEEIDLSVFDSIDEQIAFLEKRDKINKEYIM